MENQQLKWRFVATVDRKGELTIERDTDQYFAQNSDTYNFAGPFSLGMLLGLFVALIVLFAIWKAQN